LFVCFVLFWGPFLFLDASEIIVIRVLSLRFSPL
jgi:hypothetical protein